MVYSYEYAGFVYNLTRHFEIYDSVILTITVNKNRSDYQKHIFLQLQIYTWQK
jgi:hypothetical protein